MEEYVLLSPFLIHVGSDTKERWYTRARISRRNRDWCVEGMIMNAGDRRSPWCRSAATLAQVRDSRSSESSR